jgi:hypothetical protein
MQTYLQNVINKKSVKKTQFLLAFSWLLATDEACGTDPRIRIHTKMSRIHNTDQMYLCYKFIKTTSC